MPGPLPGVYTPQGVAPSDAKIRSLISFPVRNPEKLEQAIREIYDPNSARFRQYMTVEQWMDDHAPRRKDVDTVIEWIEEQGLKVERVATNRLLIHVTGSVGRFNKAFGTQVIVLERKSPQIGNPPHDVYGFNGRITVPTFIRERIHAVLTADLPVATRPLRPEDGRPSCIPENLADGYTPEQIAHGYNFDALYARGFRGKGVKYGVLIGAGFRMRDARAFWKAFGIQREDPKVVQLMEPPSTRYREGQLDVEWAGAMAPEADLIVYMSPDARNTSMIYSFNEAVTRNEVSVITDSFAHREDSEPRAVGEAYGAAAQMAAALGITIVSASGDSAGIDVPSASPYVTAVGGTELGMTGNDRVWERAWPYSGSGISYYFKAPWWQDGLPTNGMRATSDVALNAGMGYWYCFLGRTYSNIGTSFASPVFGAMIAVINDARAAEDKPRLGWINSLIYTDPQVRATFRDITVGRTFRGTPARAGWDLPTGLGAPDAEGLHRTMP